MGLSLNLALKRIDLHGYSHIFKIDGDVKLPLDYLSNLLAKKAPVAGKGACLLMSVHFFVNKLSGNYPVSYCDDGYVSALSISTGHWPPEYDGKESLEIPVAYFHEREYYYGREYYKWGMPLRLLVLLLFISLIKIRQKKFKKFLLNIAGYISAIVNKDKKYEWWKDYARMRVYHFVSKLRFRKFR